MNKPLKIIITVIVLALIIWIVATKGDKPNSTPKVIGVIVPMSGQVASMGEEIKRAIDLVQLQNLKVVYEDDPCDSKKAVSAYNTLKLQGVKLFYVACSGSVMALAPLAAQNGDLILTAYAGSSEIRKTGDEVIRFNPDALSVVDVMADYIQSAPYKKYGIIFEQQDYAKSASDGIAKILGDKVVDTESYVSTDTSFKTQITKLKGTAIDAIVFVPTSDKAAQVVLKEMGDLKISKPIIGEVNLCGYPFKPSDFGLHGVCWNAELTTDGARQFETAFKDTYGVPSQYPFYDAETYDVITILDGLLKDSVVDVAGIKKSILAGVSGKVTDYTFEPNGEVIGKRYLKIVEF